MAPFSNLVLRACICNYIYSLIRLSAKLSKKKKKLNSLICYFILLPLTGSGKIRPLSY